MFNRTLQLRFQLRAREALGRRSIELCNSVACVLWAGWQARSPALEEGGM
jgi:NADH:ubiquinone oxidoreductase subunit E